MYVSLKSIAYKYCFSKIMQFDVNTYMNMIIFQSVVIHYLHDVFCTFIFRGLFYNAGVEYISHHHSPGKLDSSQALYKSNMQLQRYNAKLCNEIIRLDLLLSEYTRQNKDLFNATTEINKCYVNMKKDLIRELRDSPIQIKNLEEDSRDFVTVLKDMFQSGTEDFITAIRQAASRISECW